MNFMVRGHFAGELMTFYLLTLFSFKISAAKKGHGAFLNDVKIEASKNQEFEDSVVAHEFSLGYISPYLPKYLERGKFNKLTFQLSKSIPRFTRLYIATA